MKKTKQIEVDICDVCGKETELAYTCRRCDQIQCYECKKNHGVEYTHSVHFSGSGDGFYCKACDVKLTDYNTDPLHNAYRAVAALKLESKTYYEDFKNRQDEAEAEVKRLAAD